MNANQANEQRVLKENTYKHPWCAPYRLHQAPHTVHNLSWKVIYTKKQTYNLFKLKRKITQAKTNNNDIPHTK